MLSSQYVSYIQKFLLNLSDDFMWHDWGQFATIRKIKASWYRLLTDTFFVHEVDLFRST